MYVVLGTIFVASLLGSIHCVGMCGPFAMMASASAEKGRSVVWPALAYSGGRLFTYLIAGALSGTAGMAVNQFASQNALSITAWQQSAAWLAGSLMIVVGLVGVARFAGWKFRFGGVSNGVRRLVTPLYKWGMGQPPLSRAALIGMFTTLMPCGWLYAFVIVAAGTGSPLNGMLVMAVFWAGTLPIMTLVVFGASQARQAGRSLQAQLPLIMSLLVIVTGAFTIAFRGTVSSIGEQAVVVPMDNLTEQVQALDHTRMPCCQDEPGK